MYISPAKASCLAAYTKKPKSTGLMLITIPIFFKFFRENPDIIPGANNVIWKYCSSLYFRTNLGKIGQI